MDEISFKGGGGNDIADAVVVEGAKSFSDGINAEIDYLLALYNLHQDQISFIDMEFLIVNNRYYLRFGLVTKTKIAEPVIFDISDYYWKMDEEAASFIKENHSQLIN